MRTCPNCSQPNREGEMFCQACGIELVPTALSTRALGESGTHTASEFLGAEHVILIQPEGKEPIAVKVLNEVILGRISEHSSGATHINLSTYGAIDKGVSRQHARLLREENMLYLMDLRSTNGTRLNGEPLPTSVEWRVRDGDEITLGKLTVHIYFRQD